MTPRQELIEAWCLAFQDRFGMPYVFAGGRDGKAASQLAASGYSKDTLTFLARKAWDAPQSGRFWNCNTQSAMLSKFVAALPNIVKELNVTAERKGF